MKLFGIGATIVPIIGGAAVEDAAAKIIEAPKVELVTPGIAAPDLYMTDIESCTLVAHMVDGSTRHLQLTNLFRMGKLRTHITESFTFDVIRNSSPVSLLGSLRGRATLL
jgi:hypothetical protein